jgi:hypothetical protein
MQFAMGWNDGHLHRSSSADGVTVAIAAVRCNSSTAQTPEKYMNALEVHGEHEFLEWIETLREGQIKMNDLRVAGRRGCPGSPKND